MTSRPYDFATRRGGSLVFEAEAPAFARIGKHYAEVEDAGLGFAYSREYIDGWREYVDAVQQAAAEALQGRRPWDEIAAEMSARYPEAFPRSLDCVPTSMLETRKTSEGRKVYLEWLAQNARILLNAKLLFAPRDLKIGLGNSAYAENVRRKRLDLLPPGRYRFDCGERGESTTHQKRLFDQFESNQAACFREVADALRALYRQQALQVFDRNDPREQVVFPIIDAGDVPLDRFRIQSFLLHESADRIGLIFDSLLDWCDEHGCAVVLESGKVNEYGWGGWDVLQSFHDDPEDVPTEHDSR